MDAFMNDDIKDDPIVIEDDDEDADNGLPFNFQEAIMEKRIKIITDKKKRVFDAIKQPDGRIKIEIKNGEKYNTIYYDDMQKQIKSGFSLQTITEYKLPSPEPL